MRAWIVLAGFVAAGCRGTPAAEEPPEEAPVAAAEHPAEPREAEEPAVAPDPAPQSPAPAAAPDPAPAAPAARPPCKFEMSKPWPRPEKGSLGTMAYPPT